MSWLARIFAQVFARRIAYVIVGAVLLLLGQLFAASDAHAQSTCVSVDGRNAHSCSGPGEAYAFAAGVPGFGAGSYCTVAGSEQYGVFRMSANGFHKVMSCGQAPTADSWHMRAGSATYVGDCPGGTEWVEDLGRCFDPEECTARNGAENGFPAINRVHTFQSACLDGCRYSMQSGGGSCTSWPANPGSQLCTGVFQFSGETCTVPPEGDGGDEPQPDPGEGECKTHPTSGLTSCVQPNGEQCVSTNSGASICWATGETGQKSSGSDAQTRGPGTAEPTPTPPTPPETFDPGQKKGPETSTTTTYNPNGTTTTTTTTIVNNTTTHGTTPPGTPGKGPGGGGSPEGEGDENTASGGQDCDTPPVVKGDAALGMIATQTWATRCAVEKIDSAATVTGDVGDCKSPFTVEGDNANVHQLRALRAKLCGDEERIEDDVVSMVDGASAFDAAIADLDIDPSEAFGDGEEGGGIGSIVTTRFGGGGACPAITATVAGRTWTTPPEFCSALAALRLLFIAISTIWALRILGGQ